VIATAAKLSWQSSDVGYALETDYDIGQRHGRLIEACEKHGLVAFRHSKSFNGGAAVLAATDQALINAIKRETKSPVDVTEASASPFAHDMANCGSRKPGCGSSHPVEP